MHRRVLRIVGSALLTIGSLASLTRAQDKPLAIPAVIVPSSVPATTPASPPVGADKPTADVEIKVSPNTNVPRVESAPKVLTVAKLAHDGSGYLDPRYAANSLHPDDPGLWENLRVGCGEQVHRLVDDYKNFYLSKNLCYVGAAVAIAAPLANTQADRQMGRWYQNRAGHGRSQGVDDTALFFKQFGYYQYAVPGFLALALPGHLCPDNPFLAPFQTFGNRGLRALAVGAPMVGILQVGLGSDRPYTQNSAWQPFQSSHGASGHAFVGAVPFLTAASMTESRALKVLLFAGSLAPAWSRIHTDDHYFSQVLLGWSIAYLSVQAVNQTDCCRNRNVQVVPIAVPNGAGLGVHIQY